jgi:hypothetical protein
MPLFSKWCLLDFSVFLLLREGIMFKNCLNNVLRHRSIFLLIGCFAAAFFSWQSDPDKGLSTILGGVSLLQGVWAIAASHWCRKALLDYPDADLQKLFAKAAESSTGAGLVIVGVSIMVFAFSLVFSPRAHADGLPAGFALYGPILKAEQLRIWPDHPQPALLAALVEQESCISLRSPHCWNPRAQLKTSREEGAGFGQTTRAYRSDGSLRFDALADLRREHNEELRDWSWANIYQRPDYQLRALVLLAKDNAKAFSSAPTMSALALADAAHNGGKEGVQRERRACMMTIGCDPQQWFGNVAEHCLKSRQPLYGNRNACDINREHVHNVMQVRWQKYQVAMQ